jgi:hypothetical protein
MHPQRTFVSRSGVARGSMPHPHGAAVPRVVQGEPVHHVQFKTNRKHIAWAVGITGAGIEIIHLLLKHTL